MNSYQHQNAPVDLGFDKKIIDIEETRISSKDEVGNGDNQHVIA